MTDAVLCPACETPRVAGPDCPRCGVVYEKAAARRRIVEGAPPPTSAPVVVPFDDDDAFERRLRLVAVPLALVVAGLLVQVGMLRALGRLFFSMWVHELGHAVVAWMTGIFAIPGPWRTVVGDERSWAVTVLIVGAAIAMGLRARTVGSRAWGVAATALLALHAILRLGPGMQTARALVTFGGDGVGLVLGALLVASFPVDASNVLRRNALRWGLLVIGAVAFADFADTWIRAGWDPEVIPYGSIEGVGHSDPTVLVDDHGWTEEQLVARHRWAAAVGVAIMSASYVIGLRRTRPA